MLRGCRRGSPNGCAVAGTNAAGRTSARRPSGTAQPGAVFGAAPGDDRRDTHRPNLLAILVVVVGTVGIHRVRPSARAPAATAYWRDVLDHRHELGDVVAVAAGQRRLQRDAVRFGDQVMFRASSGTVDRARSGFGPPFMARRCEPSITVRDQSSAPAACSSASRCLGHRWLTWRFQVMVDGF